MHLMCSWRSVSMVTRRTGTNTHTHTECVLTIMILLMILLVGTSGTIQSLKAETEMETNDNNWNYWGPKGEQSWVKYYHNCKGRFQSPINIETDHLVIHPDLQLSFVNYDQQMNSMMLVNNGHGVMLKPTKQTDNSIQCLISGSALNHDVYRFVQFHFHWRNAHSSGSEHAINGEKFTMEMHMVHQNIKYENEEELIDNLLTGDLRVVIAVFFNESNRHNPYLDPIIKQMDKVINVNQEYVLDESIRLEQFLPEDQNDFYRYYGSYTTPDCKEIVTWIIYPRPLDIDYEQMDQFRQLFLQPLLSKQIQLKNEDPQNSMNGIQDPDKKKSPNSNDGSSQGGYARASLTNILNRLGLPNEEVLGYYRHIQDLGSRKINGGIMVNPREDYLVTITS